MLTPFSRLIVLAAVSGLLFANSARAEEPKPVYNANNPFFKAREAIFAPPQTSPHLVNRFSPEMQKKYCPYLWEVARLEKYLDMLKAFGFNSIQLSDNLIYYYREPKVPGAWRERVLAIYKHARAIGMRTSFLHMGNTVFDYEKAVPYNQLALGACWNDPRERLLIEKYYDYIAGYAAVVDHIQFHSTDPGGCICARCSVETPQILLNLFRDKCRKINPDIQMSFDIWGYSAANSGTHTWRGYTNEDTFIRSPLLAPEVMIGLALHHGLPVEPNALARVAAAGRKAGLWVWYFCEEEDCPSLHVHVNSRLKRFFGNLPDAVSRQVAWMSVDDIVHGPNMHSSYVVAQLMINPRQKPDDVLKSFLDKVFGPGISPRAHQALLAIEAVRCGADGATCRSADCKLDQDPGPDMEIIRTAAAALKDAAVDGNFKPELPLFITPAEYLAEIKNHLDIIGQWLQFRQEARKVLAMMDRGAPREEIVKAIDALPKIGTSVRYVTDCEYSKYLYGLSVLNKRVSSMSK